VPLKERILIAPLDWGLGHATRCVPIIHRQLDAGHEVMLAACGIGAAFFRKQFSGLTLLEDIPSYGISYQDKGSFVWQLVKQVPHIFYVVKAENLWLKKVIDREKITQVISDNRYGLHSDSITCFFITHQLFIKGPMVTVPVIKNLVKKYVVKYNECWVPDFEGEKNLSGELSHGKLFTDNVKYIGPLSRFEHSMKPTQNQLEMKYDFLALISGPEPQRTLLENQLEEIFKSIGKPALMICGRPQDSSQQQNGCVRKVSHLNDDEFVRAIDESKMIICRSGYSTLMDLYALKRKALLIPTPGQTEQEYLGKYFAEKFGFATMSQKDVSVKALKSISDSNLLSTEFYFDA